MKVNNVSSEPVRRTRKEHQALRKTAYLSITFYNVCQAGILALVIWMAVTSPTTKIWGIEVLNYIFIVITITLFSIMAYCGFKHMSSAATFGFIAVYSVFSLVYSFSMAGSILFIDISKITIGPTLYAYAIFSILSGIAQVIVFILSVFACNKVHIAEATYKHTYVVKDVRYDQANISGGDINLAYLSASERSSSPINNV